MTVQPETAVGAIMAGLGIIAQFGRSFGMTLGNAMKLLVVIAVIATLAASQELQTAVGASSFAAWQAFVLTWLMQLVTAVAAALGGLYGTSAAAHKAVDAGANPEHLLVPITSTKETPDA